MGAVWEGRVDFAQKPQPLGRPSPGAPRSRAPGGAGFAARTSGSLAYFCASPRCWLSSILKTSLETVLGSPKQETCAGARVLAPAAWGKRPAPRGARQVAALRPQVRTSLRVPTRSTVGNNDKSPESKLRKIQPASEVLIRGQMRRSPLQPRPLCPAASLSPLMPQKCLNPTPPQKS